tara:strand:+ start:765 stop:1187 length:423 start_codon:yes stop_codon:yes gene_type:complete
MAFIPTEEEQYDIMLTPFIDAVFLLLIYFLTATSFYKVEKDITVKLPEASESSVTSSKETEIVVNVRKSGVFVIKGRIVDLPALQELLVKTKKANPDPSVIIRGDKDSLHMDVVKVMNACLKADIQNVSVATYRQKQSGQ